VILLVNDSRNFADLNVEGTYLSRQNLGKRGALSATGLKEETLFNGLSE
jgi:hypothetical protein